MKFNIVNKASRAFHTVGFTLKKHSPEILAVVGTGLAIGGAVMACKATLKVNDIVDEAKDSLDKIHAVVEDGNMVCKDGNVYNEEDAKKDTAIVYANTAYKLVKLYGPSVVVGTLGLGCLLTSNNILRKRNIALAAAYTTIDKGFKEYRGRVIERFGERIDKELKYNIKAKEVEETVINEDGSEEVVKKTIDVVDGERPQYSDFARFFDVGNPYWEKDPEYNLTFLKQQERYANEKLQSQGYLFLNDVYRLLGIPETKAGQVVGWTYNEVCPNGDNYVDFGLTDVHKPGVRDFVNGYERTILLDFNVDGNILDLMP